MTAPRYAVALCPDLRAAAGIAAAEWLGRCAERNVRLAQPWIPGIAPALFAAITEEPRNRGFHAPLRSAFFAAAGVSRRAIVEEIQSIASSHRPLTLPPLAVRMYGERLAIVPSGPARDVATLSAECLMRLEAYRAPCDAGEIRERAAQGLSARQHALLLRWGDPGVMDEYRLAYALTGQITMFGEEMAERLAAHAAAHFAGVMAALRRIDHIVLLEQPVPGTPFRITLVEPLGPLAPGVHVGPKRGSRSAPQNALRRS